MPELRFAITQQQKFVLTGIIIIWPINSGRYLISYTGSIG